MPKRAHDTDAGLDLFARETKTIYPRRFTITDGGVVLREPSEVFDTGVHLVFDPGTYGKIESKSGLNVLHSIVSCGGVIDEGYTGSITVKLYNLGNEPYTVHAGDKIAQLIIMAYCKPKIVMTGRLPRTARGDGKFGSTGR